MKKNFYLLFLSFCGFSLPTFGVNLPGKVTSNTVVSFQETFQPFQHILIQHTPSEHSTMVPTSVIPNGQNRLSSNVNALGNAFADLEDDDDELPILLSSSVTTTINLPASKGLKSYKCDVCNKQIKGKWNFKQHKKIHTGEKSFECNYCRKRFIFKRRMKEHIRVHTGERPFGCKYCKKRFKVKGNMKMHLNVHTGAKPFECKECSKKYAYRSGLSNHKKRKHKDVLPNT